MKKLTVTTKSSAQIAAEFDLVFQEIDPIGRNKQVTQKERLEPYRKAVMKQRRRGLNWKQIAAGMALAPISEKVAAKYLRECFGEPKPAAQPQRPPLTRVTLDPVTNQTIVTPPGAETPKYR